MEAVIKILVADDHPMVRAGIRTLLSAVSSRVRCVVEEAETTEEAVGKVRGNVYDVVLMDYQFPKDGGPKATESLMRVYPQACVLGLSTFENKAYVERMVRAGARGYLLKNVDPDTLLFAIRTVMSGRRYYSNEIALQWLDPRLAPKAPGRMDELTDKEREVFREIVEGLSNRQIADKLCLSKRTVDTHRQNLMAKLGTHSAVELMRVAASMGMMG